MDFATIALDRLLDAPWRTSENPDNEQKTRPRDRHRTYRAQQNIVKSLQQHGQLKHIHVRPLDDGEYQILDGHVVVAAARQAGLQSLAAVVHRGLSDSEAQKRYYHLNLNLAGDDHAKFSKGLALLYPTNGFEDQAAAVAELCELTTLPKKKLEKFVALNERSKTWRRFEYTGSDREDTDEQETMFDEEDAGN
jgi:hypothetical protein